MAGERMWLLVDAGNSFVKLALSDGARWSERARIPLSQFGEWAARWAWPVPDAVAIANVAGAAFREPMQNLLERWQRPTLWAGAQAQGCGVVNRYRNPAQLGADRWCALVGAHMRGGGAKVVVSVGTAVTVDALNSDGVFEGGVILPGIHLMKAALAQHTAGVAASGGAFELLPRDTANGVHTGALLAIVGVVERVAATFMGREPVRLLVTGGGAAELLPLLGGPVEQAPDLVLEGLLRIAKEEGGG